MGPYLRRLRSEAGLTLRQVESLSQSFPESVPYDYLSRAETGQTVPTPEKLLTLARIYEVPMQSFLDTIELGEYERFAPRTSAPDECERRGIECIERGDYASAFACFQKCLRLLREGQGVEPEERAEKISRARNNIAVALMRLGKYRLAQEQAERALENRTASAYATSRALNTLAEIYHQLDMLSPAEAVALASVRAARRAGDQVQLGRCFITLANVRFDLKRFRAAAGLYRRAIALEVVPAHDSDLVVAHLHLGNCHRELGEHHLAEEVFRRALALAAENGNPRLKARGLLLLGVLFYRTERFGEARAALIDSRAISEARDHTTGEFHATYYLWRMAVEQRLGGEAVGLFKAMKKLRSRVDKRLEEILSFDGYLDEVRARRRAKKAQRIRGKSPSRSVPRPAAGDAGPADGGG